MDPIEKSIFSEYSSVPSVEKNNVSIHSMGDIELRDSFHQSDYVTVEPDDCLTIIYTSEELWFSQRCGDVRECFSGELPTLVSTHEHGERLLLVPVIDMGIASLSTSRGGGGGSNWLQHGQTILI